MTLHAPGERAITFALADDSIEKIAAHIEETYVRRGKDLSRLAVVFGGKRPSMFLKRELARRINGPFFPPRFFSMDEFMEAVAAKRRPFSRLADFDACYLIYTLARSIAPDILRGRESFARFLPWAQEILSFFEQADREKIPDGALEVIQRNAGIGYDVPAALNLLLRQVARIRDAYHARCAEESRLTLGAACLAAASAVAETDFAEFDDIYFCGLFYLHRTERDVIKHLYDRGKAVLFFQGDGGEWPVLADNERHFGCRIRPAHHTPPRYNLELYAGFDTHSQVALVREIVGKLNNPNASVLVVPDPEAIIPLLSEMAPRIPDVNVSLGYPLKRSSLHSLLEYIFKAQVTRRENEYYVRDYLRALRHPLIKNIRLPFDPAVIRVLVHKIEELLLAGAGGGIFLRLDVIEASEQLYAATRETLFKMELSVKDAELRDMVKAVHRLLFRSWETVDTFSRFAAVMNGFLETVVRQSFLTSYPLNVKVVEKLFELLEEVGQATFAAEPFTAEDIFKIVLDRLAGEMISFAGSPLKGFQILGILEARSLSFENVVIMDVNESVLPNLKVREPLIPREIMLSLGLRRFEQEEEIQRYHFQRLIAPARNVYLVFSEDRRTEKSRFVEELIWERQKKANALEPVKFRRARFAVTTGADKSPKLKTPDMVSALLGLTYSATRVNSYLGCPARFYFQYILGLREREDFTEEPEGAEIGILIHTVLNDSFRRFLGKKPVIDGRFKDECFRKLDAVFDATLAPRMKADAFLVREIIEHRLERFLTAERERPVEQIVSLEQIFKGTLAPGGRSFAFEARVDRIDRLPDGSLLIIDYKTGGADAMPRSIKTLQAMSLDRASIKEAVSSFQLPLYACLVQKHFGAVPLDAALYGLRTAELNHYFGSMDDESRSVKTGICLKSLAFLMDEIANPAIPFTADDRNRDQCLACPFFYACR